MMTIREAFEAAAVETRVDLVGRSRRCSGPSQGMLKAVVAQYDGDVDASVRLFRRLLRLTEDAVTRGFIADLLAPIHVMRHELDEVEALASILEHGDFAMSALSFRALVSAERGKREDATRYSMATMSLMETETSDVMRFRVLQRLALSSFYLRRYEEAIDRALSSAAICASLGAWRAASAGYSIPYNVCHAVTGDFAEADRFARLRRESAIRSGDNSFAHSALVAEFEIAVQFADKPRIESLQREMRAKLLPQQYTERFSMVFSHAILRGSEDLAEMRTLLQVLRDTDGRSRGQIALCSALIAVSYAAAMEDGRSRILIREGITTLGRSARSDPAFEQRYRRLARAVFSCCCVLIGDEVRADRLVAVNEMGPDEDARRIPNLLRSRRLEHIAPSHQGIAAILHRAEITRKRELFPAGLTSSEFEVLKLLARGWAAGKIARETDRSVNTVYNHTRSILSKLEATRAPEAVAIARNRGLLP